MESHILTAYIKTLAKINKQTLTVHLTLLRNTLVPAKKFRIVDGSSSKLIEYLKQVNYDGGTQFGSLDGSSLYKDVDLHLIFTDGLTNFGHTYKDQLAAPTAIISGDSRSDHALLNYIAETTGGRPQVIGDYLIFSGKLNSDQASLKLKFRDIDQNQHSVIYDLDRSVATNGNLLRTVWGQAKVNELLIHDKDNSQAFVELGKTYHLVTPETSLLVLETIEQYVEHEVIPPNSFPELQAEYDRRLTKISSQKIKYEEEKIESIVTQWNERIAWWNTNFSLVAAKEEKLSIGAQIDSAVLRSPAESISVHANARVREEPLGTADVYDEIGLEESVVSGARSDEVMEDNAPESKDAVIQLTAWDPATPYLEKLKSVKSDQQITTYFSLRKEYRSSIPFFFDCAEYFYQQGEQDFALQILSLCIN